MSDAPQQPQQPRIQCRQCQAVNLLGQPTCRKCNAPLPQKVAQKPAASASPAAATSGATTQSLPHGRPMTAQRAAPQARPIVSETGMPHVQTGPAKIATPQVRPVAAAGGMPQVNVAKKPGATKPAAEPQAGGFAIDAAPSGFAVSTKRALANLPDQPPVSLMTMHHHEGRITRTDFWIYSLLSSALGAALLFVAVALGSLLGQSGAKIAGSLVLAILAFMAWISTALQVRRFHDHGMSGWWILINFVPFGGIYALAMCGFAEGTKGPNKYGADPCRRGQR